MPNPRALSRSFQRRFRVSNIGPLPRLGRGELTHLHKHGGAPPVRGAERGVAIELGDSVWVEAKLGLKDNKLLFANNDDIWIMPSLVVLKARLVGETVTVPKGPGTDEERNLSLIGNTPPSCPVPGFRQGRSRRQALQRRLYRLAVREAAGQFRAEWPARRL